LGDIHHHLAQEQEILDMSYDLHVRSDDNYTLPVNIKDIIRVLLNENNVVMISEHSFTYEVDYLKLKAHIYLERFGDASNGMRASDGKYRGYSDEIIDCVLISIPYAFKHGDDRDLHYIRLGSRIANSLGWKLHDEQSDQYISL
jgi:hypothetical protein